MGICCMTQGTQPGGLGNNLERLDEEKSGKDVQMRGDMGKPMVDSG